MSQQIKQCQSCNQQFEINQENLDFYEKIKVPIPDWCPTCRLKNRLAFWPFRKFYKRKCDATGKSVISTYPPETRFPVYERSFWYSDEWEVPSLEYDSSQSFFDQLYDLQKMIPRPHQFGANNTDCQYSDDVWESKNCHICRSLANCENISYSYRTVRCRDSYDLTYCYDAEQSYDCTYCFKVFKVKHALDVKDSFDSAFLYDCRNVRNCFMCWNLRNKEYHILNKPYSKQEYQEKMKEYNLGSWQEFEKMEKEFKRRLAFEAVHRANKNLKIVNSTGDYLLGCKNCQSCYFLEDSENCFYIMRGLVNKNSQDCNGMWKGEMVYNICQVTEAYNLLHSNYCNNCWDSEYLDFCIDCKNCFGCIGLKKKKYHILNKQYSESDYKKLVGEIKDKMKQQGDYGRFFPYKFAVSGYNFSLGQMFFPKTKQEVESLGGIWEEEEKVNLEGLSIYPFVDDISQVKEDILGKALICQETKRPFNVTKNELEFLKKNKIPLPRHYPDTRILSRTDKIFNIVPKEGKCYFCSRSLSHFYRPEFGFKKIACIECYQKKVI